MRGGLDFWRCSIAVYDIVLRAQEELYLPQYKGSTLNGAIDNAFYAVACRRKREKCPCNRACPYVAVFKPQSTIEHDDDDEDLRRYKETPRAYVIEPPLECKVIFQPGEILSFRLILFGKGIRYFPWFIVALQALEQFGIGKGRGKVELLEISSVHPLNETRKQIYYLDSETGLLPNESLLVHEEEIIEKSQYFSGNEIVLEFLTPTRIKMRGIWVNKPTFTQLMIVILRRAILLSKFYGQEVSNDFSHLLENAQDITLKLDTIKWYDWKRYSKRQQEKIPMGGIVGRFTYVGDTLSRFIPYLLLGQILHIGKGYVYGMGKFVVRDGDGEMI